MASDINSTLQEYYKKIADIEQQGYTNYIVPTTQAQFKYVQQQFNPPQNIQIENQEQYDKWYKSLGPTEKAIEDFRVSEVQNYNSGEITDIQKFAEANNESLYRAFSGEYIPGVTTPQQSQIDQATTQQLREMFKQSFGNEAGEQMWQEYKANWHKSIEDNYKLLDEYNRNKPVVDTTLPSQAEMFKDYWKGVGKKFTSSPLNFINPLYTQSGREALKEGSAAFVSHIPFVGGTIQNRADVSEATRKDIGWDNSGGFFSDVKNLGKGEAKYFFNDALRGRLFYESAYLKKLQDTSLPEFNKLNTEIESLNKQIEMKEITPEQYYQKLSQIESNTNFQNIAKLGKLGVASPYQSAIDRSGPLKAGTIKFIQFGGEIIPYTTPYTAIPLITSGLSRGVADIGPAIKTGDVRGILGATSDIGFNLWMGKSLLQPVKETLESTGSKVSKELIGKETKSAIDWVGVRRGLAKASIPTFFVAQSAYEGYKEGGTPTAIGGGLAASTFFFGPGVWRGIAGEKAVLPIERNFNYAENGRLVTGPFTPITTRQSVTFLDELAAGRVKGEIWLQSETTAGKGMTTTRWNLLKQRMPTLTDKGVEAWTSFKVKYTEPWAKLGRDLAEPVGVLGRSLKLTYYDPLALKVGSGVSAVGKGLSTAGRFVSDPFINAGKFVRLQTKTLGEQTSSFARDLGEPFGVLGRAGKLTYIDPLTNFGRGLRTKVGKGVDVGLTGLSKVKKEVVRPFRRIKGRAVTIKNDLRNFGNDVLEPLGVLGRAGRETINFNLRIVGKEVRQIRKDVGSRLSLAGKKVGEVSSLFNPVPPARFVGRTIRGKVIRAKDKVVGRTVSLGLAVGRVGSGLAEPVGVLGRSLNLTYVRPITRRINRFERRVGKQAEVLGEQISSITTGIGESLGVVGRATKLTYIDPLINIASKPYRKFREYVDFGKRPLEVKTFETSPASTTFSRSAPILFVEGKPVNDVLFVTRTKTGNRFGPTSVTKLEGGLTTDITSIALRKSPKDVQELARAIAESRTGSPNLDIFGNQRTIKLGYQESKLLARLGKTKGVENWTNIKPIPSAKGLRRGRTIERSDIAGIIDEMPKNPESINFFGKTIKVPKGGEGEVKVYKETFVGKDVTFPRLRSGGKPPFAVEGTIIETTLPVREEGVGLWLRPREKKPKTEQKQEQKQEIQSTLLGLKGSMVAKLDSGIPKAIPKAEIKVAEQEPTFVSPKVSPSLYAGTGQYERTESEIVRPFGNLGVTKEIQILHPKSVREIVRTQPREMTREVTRELTRELQRQVPRELTREVPREITREIQREVPRQIQREILRQIPRQTPRQTPRTIRPPRPTRVPKPKFIFGSNKPNAGVKGKKTRPYGSYLVEVRRFRKPFLVTQNPLSKPQALSLGLSATKTTERATFRLIPVQRKAVQSSIKPITEQEVWKAGYRPKYKGGKPVDTLTFVQRRRTRMSTTPEIKAIQRYKGNPYWAKTK